MDTNLNMRCDNNKNNGNYDVIKTSNERDFYKKKLNFEVMQRNVENKELQNQLCKIQDELEFEKKNSKDKMSRLEEVSRNQII